MKSSRARRDMNLKTPPVMTTLGLRLLSYGGGKATMTLKADKRFHNPMGTLHGGILTDLADACMGMATISTLEDGESFTTLELKMNFIRPVIEGELTAQGRVLHRGKTIALAECVIENKEGKDVARGMATQMVLHSEAPA
jgi:uncharacterized protein (TIGR00369 family)